MFENFKKINLTVGLATITLSANGLSFSKTSVSKLGHATRVNILLNEEEKQLAIQACADDDTDGTPFAKNKSAQFVRWNNRDFIKTISKLMGVDLDANKTNNYKIEGEYFSKENALLFKLDEFVVSEKKDADNSEDE